VQQRGVRPDARSGDEAVERLADRDSRVPRGPVEVGGKDEVVEGFEAKDGKARR
jgi:hypothetical protein